MRHHYKALDSLRGICACMVALYHFQTIGPISQSAIVRHAGLFVDFFFILSGFVITVAYRQKLYDGMPIATYMGLRLGRVYPVHVLTTLVLAALMIGPVVGGATSSPWPLSLMMQMLAAALLLVQIFMPDALFVRVLNGPSWSIAAEVWTYLLYALLFRLRWRMLIPVTIVLVVSITLYMQTLPGSQIMGVLYTGLARAVSGFGLGVLAAKITTQWKGPKPGIATAAEVAVCGSVVAYLSIVGDTHALPVIQILFLLIILLFAHERGAISRALCGRWPMVLGMLSYSIYMLHIFVQKIITAALNVGERLSDWDLVAPGDPERAGKYMVTGTPLFADAMSLIMLATVIGLAAVVHRYVEKPSRAWSRRKLLGRNAPAEAIRTEQPAPTFFT